LILWVFPGDTGGLLAYTRGGRDQREKRSNRGVDVITLIRANVKKKVKDSRSWKRNPAFFWRA